MGEQGPDIMGEQEPDDTPAAGLAARGAAEPLAPPVLVPELQAASSGAAPATRITAATVASPT